MYGYKRENLHINHPWELKVKKFNQAGKIHVRQSPSKFASNLSLKLRVGLLRSVLDTANLKS